MNHEEAHRSLLEELGFQSAKEAWFDFGTESYVGASGKPCSAADHRTRFGFRRGPIRIGGLYEPYEPAWTDPFTPIPEGMGYRVFPDIEPLHNEGCIVVALWVDAYRLPTKERLRMRPRLEEAHRQHRQEYLGRFALR